MHGVYRKFKVDYVEVYCSKKIVQIMHNKLTVVICNLFNIHNCYTGTFGQVSYPLGDRPFKWW
jgi:hypothetical protein